MRFDLIDLRLVLNVTDAASITHGAARSGLALASASERIRDMEQELGASQAAQLLHRGGDLRSHCADLDCDLHHPLRLAFGRYGAVG